MKRILLLLLALTFLISSAFGAPVTGAASDVGAGTVRFNAAAGAGEAWFEWGTQSGNYYYYRTINQTAAGAFTDTHTGPPLLAGTQYYVRACDVTGCGAEVTFTTLTVSVSNRTYFGTGVYTMFKSGMNITQTAGVIVKPYTAQLTAPITYGLLFLFIFAGLWIRPKDIFLPCILAMLSGGMLWMTGGLGIDPMFADIGQGLLYAAIAGIVFSWFTRSCMDNSDRYFRFKVSGISKLLSYDDLKRIPHIENQCIMVIDPKVQRNWKTTYKTIISKFR